MVRERDRQFTVRSEAEVQRKIAAAEEIVRHFQSLPVIGPPLTDDDFYDKDGLPR